MKGIVTRNSNQKGAGVTTWKTTALQDFKAGGGSGKESAKERRRRWKKNLEKAVMKSPSETARRELLA